METFLDHHKERVSPESLEEKAPQVGKTSLSSIASSISGHLKSINKDLKGSKKTLVDVKQAKKISTLAKKLADEISHAASDFDDDF